MTDRVISIPLVLGDQLSGIKIGKILDPIDFSNSSIISDDKVYKLEERNNDKPTKKFLGQHFAEQTSKYVVMSYNDSTRKIEINPVTEWFLFKKDIELKNLNVKEFEERKKDQSRRIDQLKKSKRSKGINDGGNKRGGNAFKGGKKAKENMDNDDEEIKKAKDDQLESFDSHSSENDPGLKDIDSDIEDMLNIKEEKNIYKKINDDDRNKEEHEEEEEEDSSSNDSSVIDNEIENEESEINEDEFEDLPILGEKRCREETNQGMSIRFGFIKKKTVFDLMSEQLDKMLSRNSKMSYDNISKEMKQMFSTSEIEDHLPDVISENTKSFNEKGEILYYKKHI